MGVNVVGSDVLVQIFVKHHGGRACQLGLPGQLSLDGLYLLLEGSVCRLALAQCALGFGQCLIGLGQVVGILGIGHGSLQCVLGSCLCHGGLVVLVGLLHVVGYQCQGFLAVAVVGQAPVVGIEGIVGLVLLTRQTYGQSAVVDVCQHMVVGIASLLHPQFGCSCIGGAEPSLAREVGLGCGTVAGQRAILGVVDVAECLVHAYSASGGIEQQVALCHVQFLGLGVIHVACTVA